MANCKGKTLLVIEIFFTLHRYCTVIAQSWCSVFKAKHNQVFLNALLNWRKNSNFFKLAVLQSDSMKRNYGQGEKYLYILKGNYCILSLDVVPSCQNVEKEIIEQ